MTPDPTNPDSAESAGGDPDVISQLERLAALRDKGILTNEELAERKAKILATSGQGVQGQPAGALGEPNSSAVPWMVLVGVLVAAVVGVVTVMWVHGTAKPSNNHAPPSGLVSAAPSESSSSGIANPIPQSYLTYIDPKTNDKVSYQIEKSVILNDTSIFLGTGVLQTSDPDVMANDWETGFVGVWYVKDGSVVGSYPNVIVDSTSVSNPFKWYVVRNLLHDTVVLVEGSSAMQQGIIESDLEFYDLASTGPRYIGGVPLSISGTEGSMEGVPNTDYDGKVVRIDYDKVTMRYTGKEVGTVTYTFNGKKFVPDHIIKNLDDE